MQAILINPHDLTVTEVEHNGDYRNIYDLIGATTFDLARLNAEGDGVYVDDEGLFHHSDFFQLTGYTQPLAGRGLILGCDDEGDSTSPTITADWVRDNVRFYVNIFGNLVEVTG